jgi:hypothetical protein
LLLAAVFVGVLGLWLHVIWSRFVVGGLFISLGADWALYYAQTAAFWGAGPPAIYDFTALGQYLQPLTAYTTVPGEPLPAGHVPYPPLFAWLFTPFTWPSPPVGFALWTALNLCTALYLGWRVAQQVGPGHRAWVVLLVLTSLPVVVAIYYGQPVLLLACFFGEAYLALRSGRDFRAGLLIGCLLIKPQYGLLIGPLLLWKRRWSAVAGAGIAVAAILVGSWLVAGLPTLLAYPTSVLEEDPGLRSVSSNAKEMVNWRAIVLTAAPRISELRGLAITSALGLLTVAAAAFCWRGPWQPRSPLFPAQMSALMLATILANFHSHDHGATFLAVPVAAVLAQRWPSLPTRAALLAAATVPTAVLLFGYLTGVSVMVSFTFAALLVISFATLVFDVVRLQRCAPASLTTNVRAHRIGIRPAQEPT